MTDLVAEIGITYKVERPTPYENYKITRSETACDYIRKYFEQKDYSIEHREIMGAIYLNQRNNILGFHTVSIGGLNSTMADLRVLFQGTLIKEALRSNCTSIMLFHNHPSGNSSPSGADMVLTGKVKSVCLLLGYSLLDHIIITSDSYYSMADNNVLP